MASYYFFYGTLLDPDVFSTVLLTEQNKLFEANLTVKDFCCFKIANEAFPVILPELNSKVEGKIFKIPEALIERLHFFEDVGFDFNVESFNFLHKDRQIYYFSPTSELNVMDGYWSYEEFQNVKDDYVKSCLELMKKMKQFQ